MSYMCATKIRILFQQKLVVIYTNRVRPEGIYVIILIISISHNNKANDWINVYQTEVQKLAQIQVFVGRRKISVFV